jgi:hypothetical protein
LWLSKDLKKVDIHTKAVIKQLKESKKKVSMRLFDRSDFYQKHFGDLDLTASVLSESDHLVFKTRMISALKEQGNDHLKQLFVYGLLFPILFILSPRFGLIMAVIFDPNLSTLLAPIFVGLSISFSLIPFLISMYFWAQHTHLDAFVLEEFILDHHTKRSIERFKLGTELYFVPKYFKQEQFYNKYFGDLNLGSETLTTEESTNLSNRLKYSFESLRDLLKRRSNRWFIALPFTYLFGAFARDWAIFYFEQRYWQNLSFYRNSLYFIWITFGILVPVMLGIIYRSESRSLNEYLKLEEVVINKPNQTDKSVSSVTVDKSQISRLKELEQMLRDGLITEEDYNSKKAEILKDL